MNVLVIGKPTYTTVLRTNGYPEEGSKTKVIEKHSLGGGASLYAASLLGKWNSMVAYSGVVGSDHFGNEVKMHLDKFNVGTKFLEINYEHPTNTSYIIINGLNGSSTEISNINDEINLSKYKYDFTPDIILMDGSDMAGSLAALNNYPNTPSILFANRISENVYDLSKKCTHVIANTTFAEALTKLKLDDNQNNLVNFMQKIKDLHKANYIIMMREKGVLYVSDNQVKMMPALNVREIIDDTHAGYVFFGAFAFGMINNFGIDNAVKLANAAAGLSLTKLGSVNAMLELEDVLNLTGLKMPEKIETLD